MADELKDKKLLLVDDDADVLAALKAALSDSGAEIDTASDGNTAVTKASSGKPDLIVLDLMLPKRSGFLVLERLKSGDHTPRVIMITGNMGSRHRAYAEALGVDVYMTKPFRMDKLVQSVKDLLS
jgi:DNA-binding response OmpR family regulator